MDRAPRGRVLTLWSGLGYYRRAENLKKCARALALNHRGRLPNNYQALRALPGVGDYTAGAVSSLVAVRQPGASLLPHIDDLRTVSATVAMAVVEAAEAEGLATVKLHDIAQQVQDAMWQPQYRRIHAS